MCLLGRDVYSRVLCVAVQKELSKLKNELEAEKRDLVRTLERTSQEVEGQSGKWDTVCLWNHQLCCETVDGVGLVNVFLSPAEDLKRLGDRLADVSATNMQLQLKVDQLEALEVSIKVHPEKTQRLWERTPPLGGLLELCCRYPLRLHCVVRSCLMS